MRGEELSDLEAVRRLAGLPRFRDGVGGPIRVDEHTPMSFDVHLAGVFGMQIDEPADPAAAQRLVTAILKERRALLILDNAVEWHSLEYMLPQETESALLITSRSRELYDRLRLRFTGIQVAEIALEKFTEDGKKFFIDTPRLLRSYPSREGCPRRGRGVSVLSAAGV